MQEFVKVVPKAANAFKIEVYNAKGNLAYVLICHTDSNDKLKIVPKTAEGKITTLTAVKGLLAESQVVLDFDMLSIEPLRKELDPKKRIAYITSKLSDIKPAVLGSYLRFLREAWLHATEGHRKQLLPAMEAAFREYPFLDKAAKRRMKS